MIEYLMIKILLGFEQNSREIWKINLFLKLNNGQLNDLSVYND